MHFKNQSNPQLVASTRALASEERRITAQVLAHLEEIERRRIHLELGYSSLFAFCQGELHYSEDQAQARISAMRLTREVPEVRAAVEEGRMSLTNLAKTQCFFRKEKQAGKLHAPEAKRALLQELEGKSVRECERKLAALAPEHVVVEKTRAVSETQTQLTIVVSAELLADLEKIKKLWAHHGELSYAEMLARMAQLTLKKIDPALKTAAKAEVDSGEKRSVGAHQVDEKTGSTESAGAADAKVRSRYIPSAVKRTIWNRDQGRCTYVSVETGKRCDSSHALQFDHVHPFAKGGSNSAENLRLVCRAHNGLYAVLSFGAEKMRWYAQ